MARPKHPKPAVRHQFSNLVEHDGTLTGMLGAIAVLFEGIPADVQYGPVTISGEAVRYFPPAPEKTAA
jgi:hypothetical protein